MNQIELKALAKINLGLDVLGRRENGYHDVRMIMQSIYLYDEVKIEKKDTPGIEVVTNLSYLPVNEDNIAYKAAELLKEEFHINEGVKITLKKHIPVAAGLAGGQFQCCRGAVRDEPDVPAWPFPEESDGARSEAGSRCPILHYAGDSPCGGDR